MPKARRLIAALAVCLVAAAFGCAPKVEDTIEADINIRNVSTSDNPPTRDGEPVSVDKDGRPLPTLFFAEIQNLDRRPRSSSDIEITYATLELVEPADRDLAVVRDIAVYLLPKGTHYRGNVEDWRLVATSDGFSAGQRTADFALEPRPDGVERFIRDSDEHAGQVWVAIIVTLHREVDLPEEGIQVRLQMDLEIGL